ncbi:killer toxin alpha/beta [Aspergillus unguis]
MYIHPTGIVVGLLVAATAASGSSPHNNSAVYKSLYSVHSNSTPVFQHVPGHSVNRFVRGSHGASEKGSFLLTKRDDELPVGTCAPGIPCVNGACCSDKGICGFSPDECGKDTCISNCDAKAECGQYAPSETFTCPLNVCCSEYGFCGTTEDFCEAGCQEGYGGCGSVTEPSCGSQTMMRTVGYYEGWASTRSCDKRLPSDIDVAPLTHINFAFAFFHPTTFEMTPMNAGDEALYPQFTALKSKKPLTIGIDVDSFQDATNSPNTQTAFSDMAGSAENRRTFINSLLNFMQTWGFDGVDLDWEYPGADDRGGITADTANFVHLLRDMKNAFGGSYGISVTLPASYWYLRWFDVQGMQEHVDFFNIMTYDIHGVWDASNKHTGPYVRPHTNITEIKQGLDLLWRNEIDPSGVNFGLGWYGRSFTLEDPSCNRPDCIFSYGGKPGECTQSSGTLSNSEIQRIIAKHDLTPTLDADAAVKWITWDADQWVSYDDGETIQMKMAEANKLCLGGVLIWAVDLDGSDHASSNDLLGVGVANGVSPTDAETFRTTKESLERAASIGNSCYWSFCGDSCVEGFTSQTYSKGQVPNILGDVSCTDNSVRTLCCAPGTTTGTCSWQGWNGVGMTCSTGYCPEDSEVIAMNTNSYQEDADLQINNNHTCNGGAQTYCCSGFVPSQIANTDSLSLLGDYLAATDAQKDLVERFVLPPGSRPTTACTVALGVAGVAQYLFKVPIIGPILAESAIFLGCAVPRLWKSFHPGTVRPDSSPSGSKSQSEVDKIAHLQGQGPAGIGQKPHGERKDAPKKHKLRIGQYEYAEYDDEDLDCETTYTCDYGRGFDEVIAPDLELRPGH